MKACCTNEIQNISEISEYEKELTKDLFQDKQKPTPTLYQQIQQANNFYLNTINDDMLVTLSNIVKPLYIPITVNGKIIDQNGNETDKTYTMDDLILQEPINKPVYEKTTEDIEKEYEEQKQKQIQQVEEQFQKMITDLKMSTLEDSQHVYDKFEIERQKLQQTIQQQQYQLKILEEKQKQSDELYKKYQEQDQTKLLKQQLEQQRLEFSQMFETQKLEIQKLQQSQELQNQLYKQQLQQEYERKLQEERQKLLNLQNKQLEEHTIKLQQQAQQYQQQIDQIKQKLEQDEQQILEKQKQEQQQKEKEQQEQQQKQQEQAQNTEQLKQNNNQQQQQKQIQKPILIQQFQQNQQLESPVQQSTQQEEQIEEQQQLEEKITPDNKQLQQNINRVDSNLCDNISYNEEQCQKLESQDQYSQFPNEFRNCASAIEVSMNNQVQQHTTDDAFICDSTLQSVQNVSLQQQPSMLSLLQLQPGQIIAKQKDNNQQHQQLPQLSQITQHYEEETSDKEQQKDQQQIEQQEEKQEQPQQQEEIKQTTQKLQCKVTQDQLYLSQNGKILGVIKLSPEFFDFDQENLIIKLITIDNNKIKIQCKSQQEFEQKKEMLTNVLYQVKAKEYIEINDVYDQVIIKRNQQIIKRFNFEDLQCKLEGNLLHFIKQDKIIYTVKVNEQIGQQIIFELEKRGVKSL